MSSEPAAAQPAVQKSVDAIVRQAMEDHLRSLMAGQPERVRYDFAPEVRDRVAEFEGLAPAALRGYQVVRDRVDGSTSYMVTRLEGADTRELEWVWTNVEGRFRIVDVRRAAA